MKTHYLQPGPVYSDVYELPVDFVHHRQEEFSRLYSEVKGKLSSHYASDDCNSPHVALFMSSGTGAIQAVVDAGLQLAGVRARRYGRFNEERRFMIGVWVRGIFGQRFANFIRGKARLFHLPVEVVIVDEKLDDSPDYEALGRAFEDCELIYAVDVETSTGKMMDLDRFRDMFSSKILVIDGISSLGIVPRCVRDNEVWIGASQKAFASLPGVAFVLAGNKAYKFLFEPIEELAHEVYEVALDLPVSYFDLKRHFDTESTIYTFSYHVLYTFNKAFDEVLRVGEENKLRAAHQVKELYSEHFNILPSEDSAPHVMLIELEEAEKVKAQLAENGFKVASGQAKHKGRFIRVGLFNDYQVEAAREMLEVLKKLV